MDNNFEVPEVNETTNDMKKIEGNVVLRHHVASNQSHIPVPKNQNKGHFLSRRNSFEKSPSVAAHRAAFEKLDAAAINESPRTRTKTFVASLENHKNSENSVPVKILGSSHSLNSNNFMENRWKTKYEESEKRRKTLLLRSETGLKDLTDLEKRCQLLTKEKKALQLELEDQNDKLNKLRSVSEAVCLEYEQLKHQYDIETGAMHKAMQQASQWYKQNRQLKRTSQLLTQKILQSDPGNLPSIDLSDEVDSEIEDSSQIIQELTKQLAQVQTELSTARLQEFEAQEQVTFLTAELEKERALRESENEEMKELKTQYENIQRISRMVADEVETLKDQCDRERESAQLMKKEADRAQKERNVLAHQSALLRLEVGEEPGSRLFNVVQEVETLKRLLEEAQQNHAAQIQELQDQLEEKESNVEFEIVEEKLKLAESELEMVVQRAERAEHKAESLNSKVKELEEQLKRTFAAPPPPPPPPPPPLPPKNSHRASSSIKLLTKERSDAESQLSAISRMENMLGIASKSPVNVKQQPAIDDIISQIKGGRFTLKQTDKQREEERRRKREAEKAPPAVSEMLTILGTMRRRAKPIRQSLDFSNSSST